MQSILLYGSETWVVSDQMEGKLNAFHKQVIRRLTGRHPVFLEEENRWDYPSFCGALEEVGMRSIGEYITQQRRTLTNNEATAVALSICCETEKQELPGGHRWWWHQELF